jgi:hypothetical protein
MSNKQRAIIELLVGIPSFVLFYFATNWMATAGLFLIIFANNIGQGRD